MTAILQQRTLVEEIETSISDMGLRPGDRLPPEEELAARFGITRHQMRKGLAVLKTRGQLVQRRGAGTFIPVPEDSTPRDRSILFIGPFSPVSLTEAEELSQRAYKSGFYVKVLDTGGVRQNPAHEQECLRRLIEQPITGLILEPTPFKPHNFSMLHRLTAQGTKVALLNCPVEAEREHTVFMMDFRKAGYMACIQLAMQGYKRQHLVSAMTLDTQWEHWHYREGAMQAAADFGVDMTVHYGNPRFDEASCSMQWQPGSAPPPAEEDAGYLCSWVVGASFLRQQLLAAGCHRFGLIAANRCAADVDYPYVLLDSQERYRRILEYLIRDDIAADEPVHNVVEPILILPGQGTVPAASPSVSPHPDSIPEQRQKINNHDQRYRER